MGSFGSLGALWVTVLRFVGPFWGVLGCFGFALGVRGFSGGRLEVVTTVVALPRWSAGAELSDVIGVLKRKRNVSLESPVESQDGGPSSSASPSSLVLREGAAEASGRAAGRCTEWLLCGAEADLARWQTKTTETRENTF